MRKFATDATSILLKLVKDTETERQNSGKSYYFNVLLSNYITKITSRRAGTLLNLALVIHLLETTSLCLHHKHTAV